MRSAESLLLRLNPKTQSITVHVDGMRTMISPSDVAAALSGLPSACLWIAKAITLSDPKAVDFLRLWLLSVAVRLSHDRGWGITYDQKQSLAEIVHKEIVQRRCNTCKGRKLAPSPDTHRLDVCRDCDGLGYYKITPEQKAEMFHVKRRMYFYKWRHKEAEIQTVYNVHENQIHERLFEKFGAEY